MMRLAIRLIAIRFELMAAQATVGSVAGKIMIPAMRTSYHE